MNTQKVVYTLVLLLLLLHFPACMNTKYPIKTINIKQLEAPIKKSASRITPPSVTIWIHGTFFFTNHALPRFIRCPKGLSPISYFSTNSYYAKLGRSLVEHSANVYSLDEFYIFGWSGKLSFHARKTAAHELYQALLELIIYYEKKYGEKPFLRIITHSHGGNVVLNMASIKQQNQEITIDEAIFLACPVQEDTKYLIHDPMFKKIISLFSTMDIIQIIDPQGIYPKKARTFYVESAEQCPIFSERLFDPCEKLTQARLIKHHRGLFHIEFMLPGFLKNLPAIIHTL